MKIDLTDSQKCTLNIAVKDKVGQPGKTDGPPAWFSSNTDVAVVTASDDGLSALVETTGALGLATVSVSADADLGSGTTQISGSIDIEVGSGPAVTVEITAGTPEEK